MEAYCSYEICELLKKKGFNEPCSSTYDTAVSGGKPIFYKYDVLHFFPNGMKNSDDKYGMVISAPTHQMACAWLREKHNMHIDIDPSEGDWHPCVIELETWSSISDGNLHICDTYEEAVEAALKYVLENLI